MSSRSKRRTRSSMNWTLSASTKEKGSFEVEPRLRPDLDDFTEAQHDRLLAFVDHEDRRPGQEEDDDGDDGDDGKTFGHQLDPPGETGWVRACVKLRQRQVRDDPLPVGTGFDDHLVGTTQHVFHGFEEQDAYASRREPLAYSS